MNLKQGGEKMCVPISVVTKGKVSGCRGFCRLVPHISALILLCAGFVWNFIRGFSFKKRSE